MSLLNVNSEVRSMSKKLVFCHTITKKKAMTQKQLKLSFLSNNSIDGKTSKVVFSLERKIPSVIYF